VFRLPSIRGLGRAARREADRAFREVGRRSAMTAGGGVEMTSTSAGVAFSAPPRDRPLVGKVLVNIGAGKYSLAVYYGKASGAWGLSSRPTIAEAWEYNLNATVATGTYVRLIWHREAQEWRFAQNTCS
jgi:hypothetical protein